MKSQICLSQIEKLPEHCKNFSIDLKENFETDDKITNRLGIKLGKCLADIIKEDQSRKTTKEEEPNARVARSLIESLGEPPVHVRFIGSEVSLCGYMYKENEQWRELYFWKGKADAIGWDKKNEKFVIVEWKVKEANESKDVMAFKPFQFQSLVYAKLLKLLLELKYLPSILIVLIDGQSGKKVHAGFFEAPDSLGNEYVWSDRKPELTIEIQPGSLFREGLNEGEVREDMPLSKLFSDNATLEDLQKFFKTPPLKVIPKHNNA